MAQVINTNVLSINAQRNLSTSQSSLATALQRLSSGLRINSAKDDAAGLAISDRFTTQIRGLNQAVRNASDGISLAQTAESALGELTNNLQRIREIAVQAANASNSASDRAALDQEVQQRLAEVQRIATQTAFNGQKVLDGTFGNATFQVGANVGETISLSLGTDLRTTAIGKTADYVGGVAYDSTLNVGQQGTAVDANALLSGAFSIAIGSGSATAVVAAAAGTATGQTTDSAFAKAAAINSSGISGLTATADTTAVFAWADVDAADYDLTINGRAIYTDHDASGTDITGSAWASVVNANSSATGVSATYDATAGTMTLQAVDGRNIVIAETEGGAAGANGLGLTPDASNNSSGDAADLAGTGAATIRGSVRLTAAQQVVVSGTAARIGFTATSLAVGDDALSTAGVTTVSNANTTIMRVDSALSAVSGLRSTFGAIQNRFESTIASLSAVSENLEASRSRILDADFAAETAALTKAQILQQAGVAILAQANSQPQSVLALLQ
jgi:flagellin